jgi:tRNA 2-selenouridine synthase
VQRWQALAREGDFATTFEELMTQHYDPIYLQSMRRNFARYAAAPQVAVSGADFEHFRSYVQVFIQSVATTKIA